ncbi:hypothetical protein D3C76_940950 [compost metagenome]
MQVFSNPNQRVKARFSGEMTPRPLAMSAGYGGYSDSSVTCNNPAAPAQKSCMPCMTAMRCHGVNSALARRWRRAMSSAWPVKESRLQHQSGMFTPRLKLSRSGYAVTGKQPGSRAVKTRPRRKPQRKAFRTECAGMLRTGEQLCLESSGQYKNSID